MTAELGVRRLVAGLEHAAFPLLALAVLALVGSHDFWRDEYQAWLIARGAATPLDLWSRLRFEGHPPLYYLVIWPLAHCGLPPVSAKIVIFPVFLASAWLVLRQSPGLTTLGRFAVVCSSVFANSVLAQPYAFAAFFLLASESLVVDADASSRRRFLSWVCLGLAAATDLPAAAVGGALALDRLTRGGREYVGAAVALFIAIGGLVAAYPDPSAQSVFASLYGTEPWAILDLMARVSGPLASRMGTPVGVLAFLLVIPALCRRSRLLLLLALCGLFPIAMIGGATQSRHAMALFVLVVILLARAGRRGALELTPATAGSRFPWRLSGAAAVLFFIISLVGGLAQVSMTAIGPRSLADDAAESIRPMMESRTELIASPDYLGTAFAATLDRSVWSPECECLAGAVRWTRTRNARALQSAQMRRLAIARAEERVAAGVPVLLILPAAATTPPGWVLLRRWAGGRSADEDLAIFRPRVR